MLHSAIMILLLSQSYLKIIILYVDAYQFLKQSVFPYFNVLNAIIKTILVFGLVEFLLMNFISILHIATIILLLL